MIFPTIIFDAANHLENKSPRTISIRFVAKQPAFFLQ